MGVVLKSHLVLVVSVVLMASSKTLDFVVLYERGLFSNAGLVVSSDENNHPLPKQAPSSAPTNS